MVYAIVGIILVIVSLFFCWWLSLIGAVLGIIGLCTAGNNAVVKGLSIGAIIVGVVCAIISLCMFVL